MVPITFCLQTDEIKTKRMHYKRVLLAIDLLVYGVLITFLIYELAGGVDVWFSSLSWNLLAIVTTICLCLALRRIRRYTIGLSNTGMEVNQGLLSAHQASFVAAAVISSIVFTLETV